MQVKCLHHKMFFRNITLLHQKKRASFLSLNTGVSEKVVHISEILFCSGFQICPALHNLYVFLTHPIQVLQSLLMSLRVTKCAVRGVLTDKFENRLYKMDCSGP